MPTPIYLTGWEHGAAVSTNGSGLYVTVAGTWADESTTVKSGSRSIKGSPASGAACNIRASKSVAGATCVQRFYVNFGASLPGGSLVVDVGGCANSPATGFASVGYNPVTGFFCARVGAAGKQEDNVTVQANTWYRIDFKSVITGGNMVVDVQIDGRAITQVSVATSATSQTNALLGTVRTDHLVAWTAYYDDWIVSATSGDYPIGAGGTQGLKPSADGTNNAGTNIIEDNAGTDIGATTAYDKINSSPFSSTTYIRQAANGTGNYAEVTLENISATHSAILGAMAVLAYTSQSTTANRGACIVTKDNFATATTVWGDFTTTSDYSDGSTANLFYKTAIVSGAVDDTTVNALAARVGGSGDASPFPYWIDLMVEVAYSTAAGPSTYEDSLSVSRKEVVSDSGNLSISASASFGRTNSVSDGAVNSIGQQVSINKITGFDNSNAVGLFSVIDLQKIVSFLSSTGVSIQASLPILRSLGMDESSIANLLAGSSLNRIMAVNINGGLNLILETSIAKIVAISASGGLSLLSEISLGKSVGFIPANIATIGGDLSVGKSLGLIDVPNLDAQASISQGRSQAIVTSGGSVFEASSDLSRKSTVSDSASLDAQGSVGVGRSEGVGESANMDAGASSSFSRVNSLSDAASLDAQSSLQVSRSSNFSDVASLTVQGVVSLSNQFVILFDSSVEATGIVLILETLSHALGISTSAQLDSHPAVGVNVIQGVSGNSIAVLNADAGLGIEYSIVTVGDVNVIIVKGFVSTSDAAKFSVSPSSALKSLLSLSDAAKNSTSVSDAQKSNLDVSESQKNSTETDDS